MKFLRAAFQFFDFLGPLISLNHKGNPTYKTILGGFLSLAVVFFSLITTSEVIKDVVMKTGSDETISDTVSSTSYNITSNFPMFFSLSMSNNDSEGDYEYFDYANLGYNILNFGYYYSYKETEKIDFLYNNNSDILQSRKCENTSYIAEHYNQHIFYNSQKMSKESVDEFLKTCVCLPDGLNLKLFNTLIMNKEIQDLSVSLNTQLFLEKYKDRQFVLTVNYLSLQKNLDLVQESHRLVWEDYSFYFDFSYQRFYLMNMKENVIKQEKVNFINSVNSDNGPPVIKSFFPISNMHLTDVKTVSNNKKELSSPFEIYIEKTNYVTTSTIKYKSLSDFISAFGGTFDLITRIFAFLVDVVVSPLLSCEIVNTAFNFHTSDFSESEKGEILKRISVDADSKLDTKFLLKEKNVVGLNADSSVSLGFSDINLSSDNIKEMKLIRDERLKHKKSIGMQLKVAVKLQCCYCCLKSYSRKEEVFKRVLELCEEKLELTNVIDVSRRIDVLVYLLFNKKQKKLVNLESINIDHSHEPKYFDYFQKDSVDKDDLDNLGEYNLSHPVEKKLVKMALRSYL